MNQNSFSIFKVASYGLIILYSLTLIFHILILSEIIDFNIVWGGRIKNVYEMYVSESISLVINTLFILIVLLKLRFVKFKVSDSFLNKCLWVMVAFFMLNTVGNLLSTNGLEKAIFTPISFLSVIFCIILTQAKERSV